MHAVEMTLHKALILFFVVFFMFTGCTSVVRYSSEMYKNGTSAGASNFVSTTTLDYQLTGKRAIIIKIATNYLGTPYCYGGEGEDCFDCSGFVNAVYRKVGIDLPRVSKDIYKVGVSVNKSNLQPGDLVFFKKGSTINHVGIYYGNDKMIHASSSQGVVIQSLNESYFRNRFAGYRSIVK